jgi:hypothetical protein
MKEYLPIIITAGISSTMALVVAAIWQILKKKTFDRVKISSPESRSIKRLDDAITDQRFLVESLADKMIALSQSVIILGNTVLNGNKDEAKNAIEMVTLSERRYTVQLQERLMRKQENVKDAESAEEPR